MGGEAGNNHFHPQTGEIAEWCRDCQMARPKPWSPKGKLPASNGLLPEWTCSQCTFTNPCEAVCQPCQMCGGPAPSAAAMTPAQPPVPSTFGDGGAGNWEQKQTRENADAADMSELERLMNSSP